MSIRATFFVQQCPTCGRHLQVRLDYLGKSVRCQHCGAKFHARDPSTTIPDVEEDRVASLLARADEVLASAEQRWNPRV